MFAAALAALLPITLPEITLRPGMVISKSCRIRKSTFTLPSAAEPSRKGAIQIIGKNIVVDFQGATLAGSAPTAEPDTRKGTGISISGSGIVLKNANIRGYKVAIMATDVPQLKLENCDVSYNWRQHLLSTPEREDLADWMSYHQNEKDEWLRYGAGIYLKNCQKFEVKDCRATGGENGLMITDCNDGAIWNNDFSFMSAIGLGMYRSSGNKIMHNKFDWCVRGYSHGVYNRGQDSTGILIYEQSHKNIFAYNSATHGGDGFFLWAGQHTMDTGKGGCNDNLLYGNDFSHSPANAIEATFSRNKFVNNLLIDCWHGVWGGYSFDTLILGNTFGLNGEAIAIEHGQNNRIAENVFMGDTVAVMLWQNDRAPDPNWGYPKHRDTRNFGTKVVGNVFNQTADTVFELGSGEDIEIEGNDLWGVNRAFRYSGKQKNVRLTRNKIAATEMPAPPVGVTHSETQMLEPHSSPRKPWMTRGGNSIVANEPIGADYAKMFAHDWIPQRTNKSQSSVRPYWVQPMKGARSAFLPKGALRGRKYMIIDEWGPYDFRRPTLAIRDNGADEKVFEVLGPKGLATVSEAAGLSIEGISADGKTFRPISGRLAQIPVPSFIKVKMAKDADLRRLALIYRGEETVDYRGIRTAKGQPVRFGWSKFIPSFSWNVSWFGWDRSSVPDPHAKMPNLTEFSKVAKPLVSKSVASLDFASGGSPVAGVPDNHFLTLAEGELTVQPGEYEISVTADDGVRVWVDGKLVIDAWKYQGPTNYKKALKLGGKHQITVHHYEIDGYTALKFELAPKR